MKKAFRFPCSDAVIAMPPQNWPICRLKNIVVAIIMEHLDINPIVACAYFGRLLFCPFLKLPHDVLLRYVTKTGRMIRNFSMQRFGLHSVGGSVIGSSNFGNVTTTIHPEGLASGRTYKILSARPDRCAIEARNDPKYQGISKGVLFYLVSPV
jgi:hypothetical protein